MAWLCLSSQQAVTRTTDNTYTDAYRQFSDLRCTLVGNKIVYPSDVVGASPVGTTPTSSSFST